MKADVVGVCTLEKSTFNSDHIDLTFSCLKNNIPVIYANNIEATKITSDWYLWIHHTIDKTPDNKVIKYSWQKEHLENQTGTSNSYKPIKIKKNSIKKKYETWK